MKWVVKHADILNEQVDVLICSANVSLNLSGGVGADLLGQYGIGLQQRLHDQIAGRSPRAAHAGEVFITTLPGMPYKAVIHAVAVDAWYCSSEDLICEVVTKALGLSAGLGAKNIALAALATGYGNLTLEQFARGISRLQDREFQPVEEVRICLMEEDRTAELSSALFR